MKVVAVPPPEQATSIISPQPEDNTNLTLVQAKQPFVINFAQEEQEEDKNADAGDE